MYKPMISVSGSHPDGPGGRRIGSGRRSRATGRDDPRMDTRSRGRRAHRGGERTELEQVKIFRPDGRQLVDGRADMARTRGPRGRAAREQPGEAARERDEGTTTSAPAPRAARWPLGSARLLRPAAGAASSSPDPGRWSRGSNLTPQWLADPGRGLHAAAGAGRGGRTEGEGPAGQQTSFRVPERLLRPGTETVLEVAAIGANGNRTITEVHFVTQP
jgi:hypothetical protein